MIFVVSNENNFDVYLYVDNKQYLIEAGASDIVIEQNLSEFSIFVKRARTVPLPNYRKMLLLELFGFPVALFMKPIAYTFDISIEYSFAVEATKSMDLRIRRMVNNTNSDWIYDAICIYSPNSQLFIRNCHVENKQETIRMYKKVRQTAHLALYIVLEFLFTLIGMAMAYPFLILIYSTTKILFFKFLLYVVPFLIIGSVALVGILPMHLIFKHEDSVFYQAMDGNQIRSRLFKA